MRGRKKLFPKQIYAVTYPAVRREYGIMRCHTMAYPDLSALAAEFEGGKIGVYRLVRLAKVRREAKIMVGQETRKVRTFAG